MWEFRNRNVFGATAFSTYGAFWLALGSFVTLVTTSHGFAGLLKRPDLENSLAWFLIAFAIFNTYMMLWATRVSWAVLGVFVTLEITEILLAIGFLRIAHGYSLYWLRVGGWAGIVTAAFAWYASAAGVVNGMSPRPIVPVGRPLWGPLPVAARAESRFRDAERRRREDARRRPGISKAPLRARLGAHSEPRYRLDAATGVAASCGRPAHRRRHDARAHTRRTGSSTR